MVTKEEYEYLGTTLIEENKHIFFNQNNLWFSLSTYFNCKQDIYNLVRLLLHDTKEKNHNLTSKRPGKATYENA